MYNSFNLLIDPISLKYTCFMCFDQSKNLTNVYGDLEIKDNNFRCVTSLAKIMKFLFPLHDVLLGQSCMDCKHLLIKMFSVLQRNSLQTHLIHNFIEKINKEIDEQLKCNTHNIMLKPFVNVKSLSTDCDSMDIKNNATRKGHDKCMQCNIEFDSVKMLQEHTKILHKSDNDSKICHMCGKSCLTKKKLSDHINSHTEKECPYCFKKLKNNNYFKIHIESHHKKVKRKRKTYDCSDCNYKSVCKNTLEAHINKVHLRLRKYKCDICCNGFFQKSNLLQHIKIHEFNEGVTCEMCGEHFVSQKTLIPHLKLHKGQKSYECSVCDEKFVSVGRRSEHMKRKHLEKKECCYLCNKKFATPSQLQSHIKTVHCKFNIL